MAKTAYASVGVNLNRFMAGMRPTTQPGAQVTYYDSRSAALDHLSTIDDGKHHTACLMQVNVDENKLTAGKDPHVVGIGTLQIQNINDASLVIQSIGNPEPIYITAGKCDWNQAREAVQFMQMQEAKELAQTNFAQQMVQDYINHVSQTCDNHGYNLQHLHPGQNGALEAAIQNACAHKLNDPTMAGLTEMQKASVLLKVAHEEAMKFVEPLGNANLEQDISVENFLASRAEIDNLHIYTAAEIYHLAMVNYTALPLNMQQDAMHLFDQTMQKAYDAGHDPDQIRADVLVSLTKTWEAMMPRLEEVYPDFIDGAQHLHQTAYLQASDMGLMNEDDIGDDFADADIANETMLDD